MVLLLLLILILAFSFFRLCSPINFLKQKRRFVGNRDAQALILAQNGTLSSNVNFPPFDARNEDVKVFPGAF